MARRKGIPNKQIKTLTKESELPPKERLNLFANIIVDRIIDDQLDKKRLYRRLKAG